MKTNSLGGEGGKKSGKISFSLKKSQGKTQKRFYDAAGGARESCNTWVAGGPDQNEKGRDRGKKGISTTITKALGV